MKPVLTLFLIVLGFACSAQQVRYQAIILNQCTDQLSDNAYFFMEKDSTMYGWENFEGKPITLPDTGTYTLHFSLIFGDFLEIKANNFGLNRDTFYATKIDLAIYVSNPPHSEYRSCDSLCEGAYTDYYYSGQIRKIGKFKNGQPIDTLKEFYRNGVLKSLYYPFRKTYTFMGKKYPEHLDIDYDADGNCISYRDTKKGIAMTYRPDHTLITSHNFKGKRNELIAYFAHGSVKTNISRKNKTEYHPNGNLYYQMKKYETLSNRWFALFDETSYHYLTYDFQEYDSTGTLVRSGKFVSDDWEYVLTYGFPEDLDQIPANDISGIIYEGSPRIKEVYYWKEMIRYEYRDGEWVEVSR